MSGDDSMVAQQMSETTSMADLLCIFNIINPLASGRYGNNFKSTIFKQIMPAE